MGDVGDLHAATIAKKTVHWGYLMQQRIAAFGYHDQVSPRHTSVLAQLQKEGSTVVECHTSAKGFWPKVRALRQQYQAIAQNVDTVLVTFPGHYLMPVAWWLTRSPRKHLIFDAFISLHDTMIADRQKYSRWNPRAWFLWLVDYVSCHLADEVLIDTEAHRQFFIKEFHLNPKRIRVIYLEARHDLFRKREDQHKSKGTLEVFFYGSYIPLQGIEHILRAAKILQEEKANVHFTLVGKGQTFPTMEKLARDLSLTSPSSVPFVTFVPFVPLQELADRMSHADLCLGIFGTSGKAQRVIPHKVYDAVASGIPVLTADSPAVRERFQDNPKVILCPTGNPEAIAKAIKTKL
jgi:glycosyltransferase involved in cell wall biosynthesis